MGLSLKLEDTGHRGMANGLWRRLLPHRFTGSGRRHAMGAVTALVAASFASPLRADVIEISPEGAVSVRTGAGAAIWGVVGSSSEKLGGVSFADLPSTAITQLGGLQVPERYASQINRAAAAANISPALLSALVWQESRWNANAVSPKGAIGLAQLMPATARELGVDPSDPGANLIGGARYLRRMLDSFQGDVEKALAAYNAGPNRVRRANGIPPIRETQTYVRSIVKRLSLSSGANR